MRAASAFLALGGLLSAAPAAAQDFNGDGYADLAAGAPGENLGRTLDAGAVLVLYGSAAKLAAAGNQFLFQGSGGVPGSAAAGDAFGSALAHGDFDGDGYDDLAVGAPFEELGALADVGTVTILRGGPSGLSGAGAQVWHQDAAGIVDAAETGDRFGAVLAAGDCNGDGYADLAIAATHEDLVSPLSSANDAGAVHVLYGSAAGLTGTASQFWHQNTGGVAETSAQADWFGTSLAAGDFDGNGCDDLAIGVPYEDQGPVLNAGAVHVLFGTGAGLAATGSELWYQAAESFPDDPAALDLFGEALAAGDFDGDGYDDLAIGAGHEDVAGVADAGMVAVLFGDPSGLSLTGAELILQNMILDVFVFAEMDAGDLFGATLEAADFDGDGYDDLAIGAWNDHVEPSGTQGGSVDVVYGSVLGLLVGPGSQHWNQASLPGETVEDADHFGRTLSSGDFDGSGRAALAVGVPDEDLGSVAGCGLLQVLYGDALALQGSGSQLWSQNSAGVLDANEAGDRVGGAL